MTNTITVDQIEQLAVQLPLPEQMRIVARITQRLSELLVSKTDGEERERPVATGWRCSPGAAFHTPNPIEVTVTAHHGQGMLAT